MECNYIYCDVCNCCLHMNDEFKIMNNDQIICDDCFNNSFISCTFDVSDYDQTKEEIIQQYKGY